MNIFSYSAPRSALLALALLALYLTSFSVSYLQIYLITNIMWTFIEYVLHRWTFHSDPQQYAVARAHRGHHKYPNDMTRFFIPLAVSVPTGVTLFAISYLLTTPLITQYAMSAGIWHYLTFELCHFLAHTKLPLGAPNCCHHLAKYHRIHHALHNKNYGFSSPFWDIVFGTCSYNLQYNNQRLTMLRLSPFQVVSFHATESGTSVSSRLPPRISHMP